LTYKSLEFKANGKFWHNFDKSVSMMIGKFKEFKVSYQI